MEKQPHAVVFTMAHRSLEVPLFTIFHELAVPNLQRREEVRHSSWAFIVIFGMSAISGHFFAFRETVMQVCFLRGLLGTEKMKIQNKKEVYGLDF